MTESEDEAPRMVMFAGPNGSGKSTVTAALLHTEPLKDVFYINADDIANEQFGHVRDDVERNTRAAEVAEILRRDALDHGQAFAFETLGSTVGKLAFIDEARAQGFQVDLFVVTTADPTINVQRVANRVSHGGHPIAPDKVIERWHRVMALLPAAFLKADTATVFDNSAEGKAPALVAEKSEDETSFEMRPRPWVQKYLIAPLRARQSSREHLVGRLPKGALLQDAETGDGKTYRGALVHETNMHLLQRLSRSNVYVLHDKALCLAAVSTLGELAVIRYSYGEDGKHR
jgi:predicted ABC-type ATPase